jgi:hypothetical protein
MGIYCAQSIGNHAEKMWINSLTAIWLFGLHAAAWRERKSFSGTLLYVIIESVFASPARSRPGCALPSLSAPRRQGKKRSQLPEIEGANGLRPIVDLTLAVARPRLWHDPRGKPTEPEIAF